MHERQAVVGFHYKQVLRPTQFYSAGQWHDTQLYVPLGPEMECRCEAPQWAVSEAALQSAKKLILITSHGKLMPCTWVFCLKQQDRSPSTKS
jgi:hypothetical protein